MEKDLTASEISVGDNLYNSLASGGMAVSFPPCQVYASGPMVCQFLRLTGNGGSMGSRSHPKPLNT
jgi:hypothetical protein